MIFALDKLEVNGMSGNESTGNRDGVCRCKLYWLRPELATYWDSVTLSMDAAAELVDKPRAQGNIPRPVCDGYVDSDRKPVPGLPANWYTPSWFNSLKTAARLALRAQNDRPLPTFVSLSLGFTYYQKKNTKIFVESS